MKTFKQVSEILEFSRDFHQRCEDLYKQLSGKAESYALGLVLEQMERHEQAMTQCMDRYRHQAPAAIMDTWVQFAPEESADAIIRDLTTGNPISPEVVFAFGKKLDAALTGMYQHLAENAESEEVRDLFSGLLEMAKHGGKKREENKQALRDHMI